MTVAVVVDGAASLPAALAEEHRIIVVPMALVIDDEIRPDTSVPMQELLARLQSGSVTTSAPAPGAFAAAIEEASGVADEVLVLTLSAEMSSTYSAAELAARLEPSSTRVVDTRTAAGGEGLVALAAAQRALAGADIGQVETTARTVIERVHLAATLDDLDHLARSGRVPDLARRAASALDVKPLFEFHDGAAHALTPAHGARSARRRIVERCLADRPADGGERLHLAVLEAHAADRARLLLDDVLAEEPDAEWFIGSFGPVMTVHVGPGVIGLAWWWESIDERRKRSAD
jgi:DegV family protein with EDD domain